MKLIKLTLALNFLTAIVGIGAVTLVPTSSQAQAPAAVWVVCQHPQTKQFTVVSTTGNNGFDYARVVGSGYSPRFGPTTWAAAWDFVRRSR